MSECPVPCDTAASHNSASTPGAIAPVLCSSTHLAAQMDPLRELSNVGATAQCNSKSNSQISTRTSSTVKAQQLAAKVEHARRLVEIQAEQDKAAAEREKAAAEREKVLADLQLQAKLAAIASSSSRGSKVESWLADCQNSHASEHINPAYSFNRLPENEEAIGNACQLSTPVWHSPLPGFELTKPEVRPASFAPAQGPYVQGFTMMQPTTFSCRNVGSENAGELPNTTLHAPELGTHRRSKNCNLYTNKTRNETVNTQDNFILLANAIADLGKKKTRVSDIPRFDGRALDWLPFKRAFQQSKDSFTSGDNIIRIAAALHGPAREAVAMLLVSADDPEQIIRALESRFAQPEYIVLQQLALVRSLPRLATYEAPRELNIFACRIRNCVEVIRLLNQPEYLAAPELANTIIGKLTPLLRSRWADFAVARVCSGKFKLENLADFLENEANLQIKFGFIMSESTPAIKSQSQPVKFTKDKIYAIASTSNPTTKQKSFSLCQYCHEGKHEVSDCKKFQTLFVNDRWQWVIDHKVCRKCLKKGSHQYKSCKKGCLVEGCLANRRHHTLLHKDHLSTVLQEEVQSTPSTSAMVVQSSSACEANNLKDSLKSAIVAHSSIPSKLSALKPLLKVIAVTVTGPEASVDTYALLDDGSSVTLLDQSIADTVGATGPRCKLNIDCINGLKTQTEVSYVDIRVKGRQSTDTFVIRARSIPNLGIKSQSARLDDIVKFKYLSDLVDVLCYDVAKPMLLIGADNWQVTLPKTVRHGARDQPAAAHTPLGWVLFGTISHSHRPTTAEFINHISATDDKTVTLDALLRDYFKLDSIGIINVNHRSASEQRALNILDATTKRLESGRFETGLLWRDNITVVPNSRELALSRFTSLERKMSKDKAYADAYKLNIQGMISKGYAELCISPPSGQVPWYLPHFGVIHPHKKKLRVVHDAAAKCAGVSLNSLLLTGPDLLQPLLSIVLRFREGVVALTGDIREMFPQVKIRVEDRDSQRFLWRESPDLPLHEFRMSSMIFGAASSPCTALYVKDKNASFFQSQHPDAVRSIIEDHYMDDFLGSFDNTCEAAQRASEILHIHKAASFEMRSWVSNCKEALALIPPDLHATDTTEVNLGPTSPSQVRVLGLTWNVSEDKLCFNAVPKTPIKFTKRSVLSLLMSVYDPLGLLLPVIMKGRILFQRTWKLGIDWDQVLPDLLIASWKSWFIEIQKFYNISVPRCYVCNTKRIANIQLHVFADASERAYACAAFWRFLFDDDSVCLSLIGGKGRLAPLKPVSIPRLELQAALIASRFGAYVIDAHRRKPNQTFYWTDSLTVLKWIRSDACTFKAFVSFRVGEITETTNICNWRYVPTALNVADDATRDGNFTNSSRWFTGPPFLLIPESDWPREPACNVPPVTEELKRNSESVGLLTAEPRQLLSPVVAVHQHFSSWLRLLRATARTHQSVNIFRSFLNPNLISPPGLLRDVRNLTYLSVKDLELAEIHLFKKVQFDSFSNDLLSMYAARPLTNISRLKHVSLFLGEDGLLRLAGRTAAAEDMESRPIVLDGKHRITRLLIHFWHIRFAHGNNELVVNELRQRFYILGLRPAVRATSQKCQFCRNRKTKPETPPMGNLPEARLAHHQRPFTYVGLDYFGPVNVTIGRRKAKRWVALFTCLTVRAVHLEIVENLTTDSALMALRRFIARRGCPLCIYSDNGTAFVGASKMLPELYEFCANHKIEWRFIPPSAPFMGGCWERLVRSVKATLAVTLKELSPREEILNTLLLEAESIINARPLTHVSVDEDAENAITPFSFLIGSSSVDLPLGSFCDADLIRRVDWRKAQRLADQFWQRFVKEYLPTLVPRKPAPQTHQFKIGDLVFIADGNLARNCWPRGRVVAVHPGKDGIVRVVDVASKGGVLRRPTRKVALLVAGQ